ncbi:MAG: hypothetical protein ACLR23_12875 [Clostridia bacterium]
MLHLCPESPFTSLDSYIKITDEGTDLVQYAAAFTFDPRCKQILLVLEYPIPDVSIYAQGDLLTAVSTRFNYSVCSNSSKNNALSLY